ncbi:hypothetical protein CPB85DRAFT_1258228 [Mucidula mucida]|nr:hypothetical protein CPB85DRAFT_1258228 [Mucidula mucida]
MVEMLCNQRLMPYERQQHAIFHQNVLCVNGLTAGAPAVGRQSRVSDMIDASGPSRQQRQSRGSLLQRDRTYTFSRDGARVYGEQDAPRPKRKKAHNEDASGSAPAREVDEGWSPWTAVNDVGDDSAPGQGLPRNTLDAGGKDIGSETKDGPADTQTTASNATSSTSSNATSSKAKSKQYQSTDDPMSVWRMYEDNFLAETMVNEHLEYGDGCDSCGRRWTADRRDTRTEEDWATLTNELYRCVTCGNSLWCKTCCVDRHRCTPLHSLRVWQGKGFFKKVTLRELGLVYQPCIQHCGCDCHADNTNTWREPMESGWYPATTVNPQTFTTFEVLNYYRHSTSVRTEWVPDATTDAARGIAHLPGGIKSATLGSAAVRCWACPRPKVNLPEGWRDVAENLNKLRRLSKYKVYPILADGLGCIVPSENYTEHLKHYVTEEDISDDVYRLRRPDAEGNPYANMDYIFWALLLGEEVADILVSYDIGCQWQVHLAERHKGMPALLRADPPAGVNCPSIMVALPVWHGAVHEEDCTYANSMRYRTGAGMTDGKGVERGWSLLNPFATATREMHTDALTLLPKRLEVAKEERAKQKSNFAQSSMALGPKVRAQWQADIVAWHSQESLPQAQKTFKNEALTEKQARAQLQEAEAEELKRLNGGVVPKGRKSSQTVFVTLGLRLIGIQQEYGWKRIGPDFGRLAENLLEGAAPIPCYAGEVYLQGQQKTSCGRTLIDSARKYCQARQALLQLVGEEGCGEFRALEKEDAARCLAKLAGCQTAGMLMGANIGSKDDSDGEDDTCHVEGAEERGSSRQTLSWIWTAQGAPDDNNEYLHDCKC